eukprot:Selendium_serpulae@DN2632_c0_g1_i1.p2
MKHPVVKWGQDAFRVYITVQFTGIQQPNLANEILFKDKSILVRNESYNLEIDLSDEVVSSMSKFVDKGSEIAITLVKTCKKHWEKLSHVPVPNLSVDWNRWVNEDDERFSNVVKPHSPEELQELAQNLPNESLADSDVQRKLSAAIPFSAKDLKNLEKAPSLISCGADDGEWLSFWLEVMTTPQRMVTLVELWNNLCHEERAKLIRHLVDNLATESPEASAHIKGGESLLNDLDPTHYRQEGVEHCAKWVSELSKTDTDTRTHFVNQMFGKLNDFDRKLVVTTFM